MSNSEVVDIAFKQKEVLRQELNFRLLLMQMENMSQILWIENIEIEEQNNNHNLG